MRYYLNLLIKVYVNINVHKVRKYFSNFFFILGNFLEELILKTCIFKTCNNRYNQEKKNLNVFATHFKEI